MFLITGNRGFIGRHLQKKLEDMGNEVYGIDRVDDYDVHGALTRVPWDRIERIYHLGAITDTRHIYVSDFYKYNVDFSIKLINFAQIRLIPIHYASSSAVYGNAYFDGHVGPLNQYALSKLMIDYHVRDTHFDTNVVGFRFFNVYGMDERKGDRASLVNKLIHSKEPAVFKSSALYWRDFICVEDVIEILLGTYKNGVYDIGTGIPKNLLELAEDVSKRTGIEFSMIPMPKELKHQYQYYTEAREFPDELEHFKFKSVEKWLDENVGKPI